jgi:snurportin-1
MNVDGLQSSGCATSQLTSTLVNIHADGLLLYVAEASYEPGTSPLSSWVPISEDDENPHSTLDLFER